MLGQVEIARYLDQCNGSPLAIEEVLSAYIFWKYIKGATSQRVLVKLRYLTLYLRVTGRGHILEAGADQFKALSAEVVHGGSRIGALRSFTEPGKAVWNQLRRAAPSLLTHSMYGGPGSMHELLSRPQSHLPAFGDTAEREPWLDRYFVARRQILASSDAISARVPSTTDWERVTTLPEYSSLDEAARPVMVA
ncbi:hypothetical protein B0H15DRAFT_818479 [Mycena belliarum]|uniref:Uncharacterized protein n=1 Tax=Mycena belliarum TaxID=1033014 RepID=A0AAD6UFY7_9AGAR|nr:hypothetical protein B0H15DRAFT_818479 [Mycena belliae]